jgi:hypothetical protein
VGKRWEKEEEGRGGKRERKRERKKERKRERERGESSSGGASPGFPSSPSLPNTVAASEGGGWGAGVRRRSLEKL